MPGRQSITALSLELIFGCTTSPLRTTFVLNSPVEGGGQWSDLLEITHFRLLYFMKQMGDQENMHNFGQNIGWDVDH